VPFTFRNARRGALAIAIAIAIAASIATALSAATVVIVGSASASAARPGGVPLTFVVKSLSFVAPDPKFPRPGDTEVGVFANLVGAHRIGLDRSACLVVDAHANLQCTTTVGLQGGTLEVVCPINLKAVTTITPIAAGTGQYAHARGYILLHQTKTSLVGSLHLQQGSRGGTAVGERSHAADPTDAG
jgi:hypothetical protein